MVFVCLHGAGKSRLAAALFDAAAPQGWRAGSAGLEPQQQVSQYATALLAGDPAATLLDRSRPRHLDEVSAELIVAIDCDVPGARSWQLAGSWPDPVVGEQLRTLTVSLVGELSAPGERSR